MADGVVLNAGAGGVTAVTDDCGASGHAQVVKLAISTDGSATLIPAEATNGLDVDVTRVIPGTSATHLGKAEDVAAANGDTGVAVLTVRDDTATGATDANGDYQPLKSDSAGRLHVIEASGAAAAASLSVLDDWDESDRAKVNPIAGQAGVQGGSGTTNALTQRVVLATDVALPAGTNAIGKLAANSGVDIGDVDVTSVIPGTGATNLGKAVDSAAGATDTGTVALAIRDDALTTLTPVDGDYTPLRTDSTGSLHVRVSAGGVSGIVDDAAFTPGTTEGVIFMAEADETSPDSVDEGDAGALRMTLTRALHVNLRDSAGAELSVGGGTQYTEDAAAAANPVGNIQMLVRTDTPATQVTTDGDNVAQRGTNYGAAYCQIVTSAGAYVDSFGGSGGTAMVDDAAFTPGTTQITPMGAMFDDVAPDSVNEGDGGVVRMSANRNLYVTLRDAAGNERGLNINASNELAVAAHNVTNAGTFAVQAAIATGTSGPAKAEDVASANADVGMAAIAVRKATPANTSDTDGDYEFLQMSAGRLWASATIDAAIPAGNNNIGDVDVVTLPNVTLAAGTNTNEVVGDAAHDAAAAGNPLLMGAYASAAAPSDVSADADAVRVWALRNGSPVVNLAYGGTLVTATTVQECVGDVADDAATAGNPVLVAGVAVETDGTDPTTVSAEGDAAYLRTDRARRLLVSEHHPRGFFVSADYGSAQTNTSVKAAPGASLSLYITDIVISNGATAGNITLLDGSGGTVVFEIYPAINGGCTISLRNPIRLTANTALCITSTTVTTHSVNIGGYIAP